MSDGALIRGEGLALIRGGRLLFDNLNLELDPGGGLLLTGPNGSGKTSLLRLLAGLLARTAGTIHRTAALALADEHVALDRELPLGRALAFWRGPRLEEAMAAFALDRLGRVPIRFLSTGQLKRATLARVMASGAPLWLLDEPLNGLDADAIERFNAVLAAHRATGGAIAAASHAPLAGSWRTLDLARGEAA